uniref:P0650D04.18 protein n=1 Tax=Oryza sativa subsp. japonica TaxID=39947 RepID=Q5H9Y4_ORYSJ|nr:P0650D04.18 [Oryza sativa Japonica Group]
MMIRTTYLSNRPVTYSVQMVVRRRSKRKAGRNRTEQEVEMDTATSAPERTETSTSADGSGKKRRGERSKNKLPKESYNVIALDQDGKPVEPPIVRSKFSNACGTLVRTRCPINVKFWETVDDNIKTLLWTPSASSSSSHAPRLTPSLSAPPLVPDAVGKLELVRHPLHRQVPPRGRRRARARPLNRQAPPRGRRRARAHFLRRQAPPRGRWCRRG